MVIKYKYVDVLNNQELDSKPTKSSGSFAHPHSTLSELSFTLPDIIKMIDESNQNVWMEHVVQDGAVCFHINLRGKTTVQTRPAVEVAEAFLKDYGLGKVIEIEQLNMREIFGPECEMANSICINFTDLSDFKCMNTVALAEKLLTKIVPITHVCPKCALAFFSVKSERLNCPKCNSRIK